MKLHVKLALAAIAAALPLVAAVPAAVHPADTEERLATALRALPAEQQAKLRVPGRTMAPEAPVSGALRPGTLSALRKQHLVPHERAVTDPAITLRYVRKIDAICTVLPAETRRASGLDDDSCAAVRTRLAPSMR